MTKEVVFFGSEGIPITRYIYSCSTLPRFLGCEISGLEHSASLTLLLMTQNTWFHIEAVLSKRISLCESSYAALHYL